MTGLYYFIIFISLGLLGYYGAIRKIAFLSDKHSVKPRSTIPYYGSFTVIITAAVASCALIVVNLAYYLELIESSELPTKLLATAVFGALAALVTVFYIKPKLDARAYWERFADKILILSTALTIGITIIIVISILFEAIKFFEFIPLSEFLFGLKWEPQNETNEFGHYEGYGFIPVIMGTLLITMIAMTISIPLGLLSAIYLTEYATKRVRSWIKPFLEMLAGIPTVIYGYFAAITIGPIIRNIGHFFGLQTSTESALAAGLVMGIMIIPFILSLSDDALNAVPQNLRDGALALGSTKSEIAVKILIPAALPGIMGSILLAISRAIGETMIVTMAAGLTAKLTLNPFDSVTTVTAQIMSLLLGDQEFDHPKTLAAFALGLVLFIITLFLNVLATMIVKKYREKYE